MNRWAVGRRAREGRGKAVVLAHPLHAVGQAERVPWHMLLDLVGWSAGKQQQVGPARRVSHHLLAGLLPVGTDSDEKSKGK
jgi:hypothetical protein